MSKKKALSELNSRIKSKDKQLNILNTEILTEVEKLHTIKDHVTNKLTARYSYPDNMPDTIKNIPEGAQKLFIAAFNATLDDGATEDEARQAGWGAVKNEYEKNADGDWVQKATEFTLRYVTMLGKLPEGDKPISRVQVFRTGTFIHPIYGKFTITDDTLKAMADNFGTIRPLPPTEMVVDYEHMGAFDPPQISPAAGWVKAVEQEKGALWASVQWTDKAAELIRSGEYKFISPEWVMDYKSKDTGKSVGPCLLAMTLTNRPFFEGMEPVILSNSLELSMMMSESLDEKVEGIRQAYYMQFPDKDEFGRNDYVTEVYDTFVIIEQGGLLYKLTYTEAENGTITFDAESEQVERMVNYNPVNKSVETEPVEAADKAGVDGAVDDTGNQIQEENSMEEQLREILGIGPEDDIVEAVQALKAKVQSTEEEMQEAKDKLTASETAKKAKDAADMVDKAITDRKLLPKMREWGITLVAKDPDAFNAFIASAPVIGPEGGERGSGGDGPENVTITATEKKVADLLGVSEEDLIKVKKAEAEKTARLAGS